MNIVADESVARPIISRLRQDGHTVQAVEELMPGSDDSVVLDFAVRANALLLTEDKDFGDLVVRSKSVASPQGIVLLRIAGLATADKADLVSHMFANHAAKLPGSFTVVTPTTVRVRKLTP